MGKNTLERGNNIDDNNLANQDGLDTSEYKGKKLVILDVFGTIAEIPKSAKSIIPTSFSVPRDVRKYLKTHPIDYPDISDLNQAKFKKGLKIMVKEDGDNDEDAVEVIIPIWVINQTRAEIEAALLYPDFYRRIKIKHSLDKQAEEYDDIIEYLKHKWYKVAMASNLSKPYEEVIRRFIDNGKFDYEFFSFNIWKQKPSKEFFEHISEVSGIGYDEMVMVWDHINSDIVWANNVWIKPIYIDRKHKRPAENVCNIEKTWINCIKISALNQLVKVL